MPVLITGRKRLQARVVGLVGYTRQALRETLRETALSIRDNVRDVAPVSQAGSSARPGQLRAAINAYLSKSRDAAYVRVGVRTGGRIQPAAQHPEFGSAGKVPRRARVLAFRVRGRVVFAMSTKPQKPKRYFRRGTAGRDAAFARGIRRLAKIIEKFPE